MNVTAFFLGYLVGMGATVFAVSLGQAAKDPLRPEPVDPDQLDLDAELYTLAERQPDRWSVN